MRKLKLLVVILWPGLCFFRVWWNFVMAAIWMYLGLRSETTGWAFFFGMACSGNITNALHFWCKVTIERWELQGKGLYP